MGHFCWAPSSLLAAFQIGRRTIALANTSSEVICGCPRLQILLSESSLGESCLATRPTEAHPSLREWGNILYNLRIRHVAAFLCGEGRSIVPIRTALWPEKLADEIENTPVLCDLVK